MRYTDLTELGGFLWWVLIRFCRTKLKDEQGKDKWSRNIFFLMILFFVVMFLSTKLG